MYLSVYILSSITHKHPIRQQSTSVKTNQFLIPPFLVADKRLHPWLRGVASNLREGGWGVGSEVLSSKYDVFTH